MEEFVKKVEELGKKFNAELYDFEYNSYEGVRIKSDWDVQFSKISEKFEEGWTILDLIFLGDDSSVANNKKICKIHIYDTVDENYQPDFYILEILDKPSRSGIIDVTCTFKSMNRREEDTKVEKTFLRKEFEYIMSWEELIKKIRKTL